MSTKEPLGLRVEMQAVAIRGTRTTEQWLELIDDIVRTAGMTPCGERAIWHYPEVCDGGVGPNGDIIVQPITESFVALDIWPDHDGAYVLLCSCRPIPWDAVYKACERAGLKPVDVASSHLKLR